MTCKKADNVKIINLRYEVNVWYAYCRPLQYEYHCSAYVSINSFYHAYDYTAALSKCLICIHAEIVFNLLSNNINIDFYHNFLLFHTVCLLKAGNLKCIKMYEM